MIPSGATIDKEIEEVEESSRTWKLDFETGHITGWINGLEAIRQAVILALRTTRYEHLIYSDDYGSELERLIGTNPVFLETELKRMITEALLLDDRIRGIGHLTVERTGDHLTVQFTVITNYGDFEMKQEVR